MKKSSLTQWSSEDGTELMRTADGGNFYIPLGTVTQARLTELREAINDAIPKDDEKKTE